MTHQNEESLRAFYRVAQGDLQAFLEACTDDVTFVVPGNTPGSGTYTKTDFAEWITGVLGQTTTFKEDVLDVFANDEHALLLLHHEFDRDGAHREYETMHICTLRDGRSRHGAASGSLREFEEAWGTLS